MNKNNKKNRKDAAMGILKDIFGDYWTDFNNAVHASDDLEAAINAKDFNGAKEAIKHANPTKLAGDDRLIKIIREYAQSEDHDPEFLAQLRQCLYQEFDNKLNNDSFFAETYEAEKPAGEYNHPLHVYGWALFTGDLDKIKELHEQGIHPDRVSDYGGVSESAVLASARLGLFECMKEVIRQGASIDRNFGLDDFAPIHYFSKPLFHIMHPGVTQALLETDNIRIVEAARRAQHQIEKANSDELRPVR